MSPAALFGKETLYSVEQGDVRIRGNDTNSFLITPCDTYLDNDDAAVLYINGLLQYKYEQETDTVKIVVDDAKGNKIAMIDQGVKFFPQRGYLFVTAQATDSVV